MLSEVDLDLQFHITTVHFEFLSFDVQKRQIKVRSPFNCNSKIYFFKKVDHPTKQMFKPTIGFHISTFDLKSK